MLMIRLQRIGKIKHPSYRLIVSEKGRDTQAKVTEFLGTYNPAVKEKVLKFDVERIKYWLSVGAHASDTVHNLLLKLGVLTGKKKQVISISKNRKKAAEKKAVEAAK